MPEPTKPTAEEAVQELQDCAEECMRAAKALDHILRTELDRLRAEVKRLPDVMSRSSLWDDRHWSLSTLIAERDKIIRHRNQLILVKDKEIERLREENARLRAALDAGSRELSDADRDLLP